MKKRFAAGRGIKLFIDIILGLLYILLLGYAFTGGQFHEVAGLAFIALAAIHNIVNFRWYRSLGKGAYSRRRKLVTLINLSLIADMTAILVTGLLNSRYLLRTGLRLAAIGRIHEILALIGLVLIAAHVMMHATARANGSRRKLPVIVMVSACVLALLLELWLLPYLKRHFLTVEVDQATVVAGESVDLGDREILTVYFTRVGNSDFDADVAAVSGASLMRNENKDLMGNSQVIGLMIQDAVGGDILPIRTVEKYPSSYAATVSAASAEMKRTVLPKLTGMPEDIAKYDTVFLVYPLWWYTIPKPVEAFLTSYDFTGKTVIPVVTHGGSGAGRSLEDIRTVCNGTIADMPLEIYCDDAPNCRNAVTEWLKKTGAN